MGASPLLGGTIRYTYGGSGDKSCTESVPASSVPYAVSAGIFALWPHAVRDAKSVPIRPIAVYDFPRR